MNRRLNQFRSALLNGVVDLFGQVAIGAAGAPTLSAANSRGIASISRTSAGLYVITMNETCPRFLNLSVVSLVAGIAAAPVMNVVSETVSSLKQVTFQLSDAAGVAADPASGEVLYIVITMTNSNSNS